MTILIHDQDFINPESLQFLANLSDRDKKFDYFRSAADAIAALFEESEYHSYSSRIFECANFLDFVVCLDSKEGIQRLKLSGTRFCRVPLCCICQWRRACMWRGRFFYILPGLLEDNPGIRFLFLTLTIRNCELQELRTTIQKMNRAWHKFIKRKDFPAIGFIKSLEITRGKDSTAHPHFHCLLAVPPSYFGVQYLTHEDWALLWKEALQIDYSPVIDIRVIKSKINCDNPIFASILEVLKYSVKPTDLIGFGDRRLDRFWLCEFARQIYKCKLINAGGIFKKYLKALEEEPEDLIHSSDICDADSDKSATHIYFKWDANIKKYRLQT